MFNCIFANSCFEHLNCNRSCPTLAQTSYLLEKNEIKMNNPVFKMDDSSLEKYLSILKKCYGKVSTVVDSSSTSRCADALTYLSICDNWKGSQLHCTVYNLKFSQYIEHIQKSWSNSYGDNSEVDYMKIWSSNAKVLIISSIDFINFKDFQCQTLLSLLQSRIDPDLTTIVVSPPFSSLVGEGPFFSRMTDLMNKQKVGSDR